MLVSMRAWLESRAEQEREMMEQMKRRMEARGHGGK